LVHAASTIFRLGYDALRHFWQPLLALALYKTDYFGFRAAYVFDVAQTDGEPLPTLAEASGDPGAAAFDGLLSAAICQRPIND